MKWSGDRLWVARGRELFASDIYDPISFTEGQYISNAKSFLLTREITALAEVTSSAGGQLVAFTDTSTSLFQSNIRDRTQWSTTDNFQRVLFPGIGCIAHKSVVTQHGLLWWYSQHGLVNFDAASASYVKSEFVYQDGEMAGSKGWLSGNLDGIAGAAFENYLLMSVPHADKYNTHTWVLDKSPVSNVNQVGTQAWNSYWTGTRPAVWVFGPIRGVNRIFQLSRDLDGTNRCWEAFGDERLDNGCPISWAAELRAYTNSNLNLKEFRWAELTFGELLGKVDIAVFWAGSARGAFKRISTKHIEAEEGVISEDRELGEEILFALKKQSRTLVTEDARAAPTETTTCQIESEKKEALDTAFQLLIVGSGPAALQAVRIFMEEQPDITSGKCEAQEDDKRSVRYDGSGFVLEADEALVDNSIVYTSNKTVQAQLLDEMFVGKGYAESKVSQGDADKIALSHAQNQVNIWLGQRTPYYVGNPDDPII